jgi:Mn2+/Fe2+ NRAMP family transporter
MSTIETRARSTSKKSSISWGRVLAAAIFSELAVIAILVIASGVYSFIVPPERKLAAQDIGELVGYYVAPPAGALATFVLVLWVARRLESNFIINGVAVGVVSVLLTSGFLAGARAEDRPMYLVAFVLRIAAGYVGGWVAQQRRRLS